MEKRRDRESMVMLSLAIALCLLPVFSFATNPNGNEKKVTLDLKSVTVKEFFEALRQQTNLSFVYNTEQTKSLKPITVKAVNEKVDHVLQKVLEGTGFTYGIDGNIVTISKIRDRRGRRLTGIVMDEEHEILPGVNVVITSLSRFAITDNNGRFEIEVPQDEPCKVNFSYIGMSTQQITINSGTSDVNRSIIMKSDTKLSEVVVNGVYTRKAESFTGSATTIAGKDLLRVGNQNVFQSLKNLDPTLYIPDNFSMGSDPNTVPTLSMRGTSSFPGTETSSLKSDYQNQPNQPLFILDGFETTAKSIMDMDMNRIQSITILKDASAKALYGSKAANGVVVIETKRIVGNQQRVTYYGSLSLEMPDLSSYDLCNAAEKLEAERLDGIYTSNDVDTQIELTQLYNSRNKMILEGLDTYWLSKPLRTGVGQKHNLTVELGDSQSLRAVFGVTYNQVDGVMKGSQRRNISGNANIAYRRKKIIFRDIFTVTNNNSSDSPYGSFGTYAKMNPYWKATTENGKILRWAEYGANLKVPNPIYDATIGTSFENTYLQFVNNFYAEWQIIPALKATARLGISQERSDVNDFYPAQHSMFANYTDESQITRRGKYTMENGKSNSISGDFNLNYNEMFGKHTLFANAGYFISEDTYSNYQYTAEGFPNSQKADITFAKQYAAGSTPIGYASINRQASFLFAASYDYDNRYLADATVRESASSLYGSDNRWSNSWSLGLGWNVHNEKFMKSFRWIKQLKLRGSIGLTGNQNFNTNAAIATYKYYSGVTYGGYYNPMTGAYLNNMPNSGLKWEQKKDHNIGLDMKVAGLSLTFDYYSADTENMLTDVTIPTSTGFSFVKDNLGLVRNSGIELQANYTIWQGKKGFVNLYGTFTYNKNKIIRLSDSMRAYNEKMMKLAEVTSTSAPVLMYQDGLSMNTIWAVPSAGIDPQTGLEIYIKKDGTYTYDYSSSDMVAAGDASPKYRGTAGFTAEYNGIGLSATVSYLGGCKMYNSTLVDRVENADISYNVDRRLLAGRWQTPGQATRYKKFNSKETTRATTRFVQDRRELNISSISAYYEFPSSIYEKLYMQRLRLAFNINDVATFSSIKIERGLNYPFARTMSFSLTGTF